MTAETPESPAPPAGWKRLALRSAAAGAGFAVAASLIVGGFLWYQSRPKPQRPWNASAITATFSSGLNLAPGIVPPLGEDALDGGFDFILENTTDSDFRLTDPSTYSIVVSLKQEKALSAAYAPKLKLPVFIPATQRAKVHLDLSCDTCAKEVGGFVLFDESTHYQISFDLPPNWEDIYK
jgi:hypothetical protein